MRTSVPREGCPGTGFGTEWEAGWCCYFLLLKVWALRFASLLIHVRNGEKLSFFSFPNSPIHSFTFFSFLLFSFYLSFFLFFIFFFFHFFLSYLLSPNLSKLSSRTNKVWLWTCYVSPFFLIYCDMKKGRRRSKEMRMENDQGNCEKTWTGRQPQKENKWSFPSLRTHKGYLDSMF